VFGLLAERGRIAGEEMERVFNMGVGMAAVVGARDAETALGLLASRDVPAWLVGEITAGAGAARLVGRHPA
jgi:phosphoribosylformylglycinamidine cyclo-ligase